MDTDSTNDAPMMGQSQTVQRLASAHADLPGALIPILHAVQGELGFIPQEAVPIIAETVNLSRAEVHGVVSFYHFFRDKPPGKHVVFVCRAEACQAMGARALADHACEKLKVDFHETTADGRYSLEPVYCLGNCACSPAIMIDQTVYGRVTPDRFDELVDPLQD